MEQGQAEGAINRELSDEAILVYIRALRQMLIQPSISQKARLDLDVLFFYGLTGQPQNQQAYDHHLFLPGMLLLQGL